MISILVPVYNGIEYLSECVTSVIAQTYVEWEMWIGINGHGDGGEVALHAKEIAKQDPRIHVIVQPPPLQGKVESLHDLLRRSSVPWIAILDCDDKWEPTKLQRQIDALDHAKEADVIGTFCQYFGEREDRITLPAGYIDPMVLCTYNPIINSSALIKREYCSWIYNEMNYGVEDFYLWMEIVLKGGRLYNVPDYLTWHRIHVTSSFNSKGYSDEPIRAWFTKQNRLD